MTRFSVSIYNDRYITALRVRIYRALSKIESQSGDQYYIVKGRIELSVIVIIIHMTTKYVSKLATCSTNDSSGLNILKQKEIRNSIDYIYSTH